MRRLWTVPGGDEARMRFVTDTLGVKLVTRQLPAESRALLRVLLVARGRTLPVAWLPPPQTADGSGGTAAAESRKRGQPPADGSDVSASWTSAAEQYVLPPTNRLRTSTAGTAAASESSLEFGSHQPAWQYELPDGPSYPNGHTISASQRQQQQDRAPADAGILQQLARTEPQPQDCCRVGLGEHHSVAQQAQTSTPPTMSYEALQGLLQKVSSVLQGATPEKDVAPLDQVIQAAGLPPGL